MEIYPSSPRELLTMMASTSTQIDVFSDGVIESVQGGEINPLTVLVQLRAMQKATERILKEIDANIMAEADKHPGQSFEYMGNTITKAEHGTKYDYANCGDPDLKMYEDQKAILEKGIKERQEFLKALKAPLNFIHDLTGEVCILTPPNKKSKSGLNVSIK